MLCCDLTAIEPGDFLIITADEQTAGRGQRGTTWESTKGENLTFNVGWKAPLQLPASPPASEGAHWPAANEQFLISEITALAVVRALEDILTGRHELSFEGQLKIKWPNDIYFGNQKICGMLLEHQLSGKRIEASIAGIGINVNQCTFTTLEGVDEGRGAPISLRQIMREEVSRELVLEAFVSHFMEGIRKLQEGCYDEIETAYTALLYRSTGWHRYRDAGGEFRAKFVSIARNGFLTLRKADVPEESGEALCTYAFKEVSYVI